jgi:hypothetical protein
MRPLIFLDFDGVLRRKGAPLYRFEKPLLNAFEAAVRGIPGAEIVIMSSWREVVGLPDLRRLFSSDVARRIVDVTPPAGVAPDRFQEILVYLRQSNSDGRQWVAVDDDPMSYPPGVPLILVDPARGFGAEEAKRLVKMAGT